MSAWNRMGQSFIEVDSYLTEINGEPRVYLRVGAGTAYLSEADAASLGGYLMGVTNNPDTAEAATAEPAPPEETITEAPTAEPELPPEGGPA